MSLSFFETYVQTVSRDEQIQILQAALIPAFRTALVSCIRASEEEMIRMNPHQEADDVQMMKVYKQLYNERALYQDMLNGIEALRKNAVETGILPPNSAPELRSVEDVDVSQKTA